MPFFVRLVFALIWASSLLVGWLFADQLHAALAMAPFAIAPLCDACQRGGLVPLFSEVVTSNASEVALTLCEPHELQALALLEICRPQERRAEERAN